MLFFFISCLISLGVFFSMSEMDLNVLSNVYLFQDLRQSQLKDISRLFYEKQYSRGEYICKINEANEYLYIIKSGQVKVYLVDSEDKERILSILSMGEYFGEMSLITGDSVSANVRAVIGTEVYVLKKNDFIRILNTYPALSLRMSYILIRRLKEKSIRDSSLHQETALSAVVAQKELSENLIEYSFALSLCLSKILKRKVLLLICDEGYQFKDFKLVKSVAFEEFGRNEIFTFYRTSDYIDVGILMPGGKEKILEAGASIISDFFKEYGHILASAVYSSELKSCNIFKQAGKTVFIYLAEYLAESSELDFINLLEKSDEAITVFGKQSEALAARYNVRREFKGPIFTFFEDVTSSHNSPWIVRAARFLLNTRIGMAFGGGGARGLAQIGVMKVLERNGVEPDVYCGSSSGAAIASFFAMGFKPDEVEDFMRKHLTEKGVFDFHFPLRSILKGNKLKKIMKKAYGNMTFDELIYELYIVCVDLMTGREVVINKGILRTAVRASGAIPGIFLPVRMDEKYLVDGGILNKVPVSVLKEKGVQNIIAVNVIPQRDISFTRGREIKKKGWLKHLLLKSHRLRKIISEPNILQIITTSFNLANYKLSYLDFGPEDYIIKPRVERFGFYDIKSLDDIIKEGENAAEESLSDIRRVLNLN